MTAAQKVSLRDLFPRLNPDQFMHGGAEGGDEEADEIAVAFMPGLSIEILPANRVREQFWLSKIRRVRWPQKPLVRNQIIAETCDGLIACPAEPTEQLRSGTWATVRYARKAQKPITLILPSGELTPHPRDTGAIRGGA